MNNLPDVSRELAIQYVRENERRLREITIHEAQLYLSSPSPFPDSFYQKMQNAGKEYGEFDLHQDWFRHLIPELQDAVAYRGFMQMQYEMRNNLL